MNAERVDVLGSAISRRDAGGALRAVLKRLQAGSGGYVCFTNVHAAVTGSHDLRFRAVTNGSFLSLADGKAVFWAGRMLGAADLGHVPGPDFMSRALREQPQHRHYFYGSTPEVLATLLARLARDIPQLNICGAHSPPFRALSEAERLEDYARIRAARAEFVWVGLGAPKQEFWMQEAAPHLRPAVLFGVGAAFDFHAGAMRRAPQWLRGLGLEWLYRLGQEPRRLWKRYLVTNTLFVVLLGRELLFGPRDGKSHATD